MIEQRAVRPLVARSYCWLLSAVKLVVRRVAVHTACIGLVCLAATSMPSHAQGTPNISRRAIPDTANAVPEYAEVLRTSGVEGSVVVRFVVDTDGRVARSKRWFLKVDHQLFEQSTQNALDSWRFAPALQSGTAVEETFRLELNFGLANDATLLLLKPVWLERATPAPGQLRYTVGTPRQSSSAPKLDSITERAISVSVLEILIPRVGEVNTPKPNRVACVSAHANSLPTELSSADLAYLARPEIAVLPARRCPKTFSSMFQQTDAQGKPVPTPPGEDPVVISVTNVRAWSDKEVLVSAMIGQSSGGRLYSCVAERESAAGSVWRSRCVSSGSYVH